MSTIKVERDPMIYPSSHDLRPLAPFAKAEIIDPFCANLAKIGPKYRLMTVNRVAHFIGQCAHESDGFHTRREYAQRPGPRPQLKMSLIAGNHSRRLRWLCVPLELRRGRRGLPGVVVRPRDARTHRIGLDLASDGSHRRA